MRFSCLACLLLLSGPLAPLGDAAAQETPAPAAQDQPPELLEGLQKASALNKAGDLDGAVKLVEELRLKWPDDNLLAVNLGLAKLRQGKLEEAEPFLEKQPVPELPGRISALVLVKLKLGEPEWCDEHVEEIRQEVPRFPEVLKVVSSWASATGDPQKLVRVLQGADVQKLIADDPQAAQAVLEAFRVLGKSTANPAER